MSSQAPHAANEYTQVCGGKMLLMSIHCVFLAKKNKKIFHHYFLAKQPSFLEL